MDRYLLISGDCHAGAPQELYRPYVDPEFLPRYEDHLASRAELLPA